MRGAASESGKRSRPRSPVYVGGSGEPDDAELLSGFQLVNIADRAARLAGMFIENDVRVGTFTHRVVGESAAECL